jgi:hypothetical protein
MNHLRFVLAFALVPALSACGTDAPSGPALTGEDFALRWGPVTVGPGEEGTRCMTIDVGNEESIFVHQIHNQLAAPSHHLVIYQLGDPNAPVTPEPEPCNPFAGTLAPNSGASPLMITQKKDDLLALPDGVAYTFVPHQRLRIELHYFNSSDSDVVAEATSTFFVGTPELIEHEASFMFIGTPDIELPPNSRSSVQAYFTPPESLAGVNFYAITGHTHALGTNVVVDRAPARDGEMTSVYAPDAFSWSEPPTVMHEPAFKLPEEGGFRFQCDYHNTTDATVSFGESATAEMCFFWAYYYPSRGSRVCVHSTLAGGPDGLDVCCPPEPGDQLSEFICEKLAEEF